MIKGYSDKQTLNVRLNAAKTQTGRSWEHKQANRGPTATLRHLPTSSTTALSTVTGNTNILWMPGMHSLYSSAITAAGSSGAKWCVYRHRYCGRFQYKPHFDPVTSNWREALCEYVCYLTEEAVRCEHQDFISLLVGWNEKIQSRFHYIKNIKNPCIKHLAFWRG